MNSERIDERYNLRTGHLCTFHFNGDLVNETGSLPPMGVGTFSLVSHTYGILWGEN